MLSIETIGVRFIFSSCVVVDILFNNCSQWQTKISAVNKPLNLIIKIAELMLSPVQQGGMVSVVSICGCVCKQDNS